MSEMTTMSQPAISGLKGEVRAPWDLSNRERLEMCAILDRYFEGVTRDSFERDLIEKEWVVVLRDHAHFQIQGFSTLMRLEVDVGEDHVIAFYSGDTIVDREYRGQVELPRVWGRHIMSLTESLHGQSAYWFLISSGYKTYRFLPVFFREFYPTYRCPTPPQIQQRMDALARRKFGNQYDAKRGIVRITDPSPLRNGVGDVTTARLRDPHVAFFASANPGHVSGQQLACLASLDRSNLTRAGERSLKQ